MKIYCLDCGEVVCAYLIIESGDEYGDFFHNNVANISSVKMHVGMVDRHTLLPWTCHLMFDSYDNHAALQSFYMSQGYNWPFHHTFCSERGGFGFRVFR